MKHDKINSALNLLSENTSDGVLPLNETTMQQLEIMHPPASPEYNNLLLQGPFLQIDPIVFEHIPPDLIQKCALNTKGAAGPSCLGGDDWRRVLGYNIFKTEGRELRKAIAEITKLICKEEFDQSRLQSIAALNACRLIPLNKNPGVRPIGIGEALKRIMGKAVS